MNLEEDGLLVIGFQPIIKATPFARRFARTDSYLRIEIIVDYQIKILFYGCFFPKTKRQFTSR